MTSLEAAARFLGPEYKVARVIHRPIGVDFVETYFVEAPNGAYLTDDELCMALLRRAEQLGLWPLLCLSVDRGWRCDLTATQIDPCDGPTPLAAVLAAVQALEAA